MSMSMADLMTLQRVITDVTGIGPSINELKTGSARAEYASEELSFFRYTEDGNLGCCTPEKSQGVWVKKNLLDKMTPLERSLIDAFGLWRPKGWERTVFRTRTDGYEMYRIQGWHDAISYPCLRTRFDTEELWRIALAILQERGATIF